MREIKFKRAHFDFSGNFIRFTEWGKFNGLFASPASLSNEAKEMAIDLQFTGLTDKNGKEIYEGDILGEWFIADGKPLRSANQVFWNDKLASWVIDNSFKHDKSFFDFLYEELENCTFEIIGNIYQNPDLLK